MSAQTQTKPTQNTNISFAVEHTTDEATIIALAAFNVRNIADQAGVNEKHVRKLIRARMNELFFDLGIQDAKEDEREDIDDDWSE